jgi:hypothetical protein
MQSDNTSTPTKRISLLTHHSIVSLFSIASTKVEPKSDVTTVQKAGVKKQEKKTANKSVKKDNSNN